MSRNSSIRLSAADRARLEQTLRVLLSPFDHPSSERWQRAVTDDLRALLRADKATFLMPQDVGASISTEDIRRDELQVFSSVLRPLDTRWSIWERHVALGAWDRHSLWGPWLDEYHRSPYYNEYIVPRRYFDAIGLAAHLGPAGQRPGPESVAGVWIHHECETGPRFGDRGVSLLRLALPAFAAGVGMLRRLDAHRAAFERTLDGLGQAILVASEVGQTLHQTPALGTLLAADPEGPRVLLEMARAAGVLARARHGARSNGRWIDIGGLAVAEDVATAAAKYRLRAAYAGPELLGGGATVLVSLERLTPEPPSPDTLRERYGLTPRQARVALLLADGRSHGAVAQALGISPHTARRHAEQVRSKLAVHTNIEVGAVVRGYRNLPRP